MLLDTDALAVLAIALLIDAVIGDPDAIWRRFRHPVTWIGGIISVLDSRLNLASTGERERRRSGILAMIFLLAGALTVGFAIQQIAVLLPASIWIKGILASVLIAQKSLWQHVARVGEALTTGGLSAGRQAVAMIVGRSPESLDEPAICRAAIESCAENFADGVVAPAFWLAVLGLPGLIACKAINTADSMIGHRTPRHEAFGWAAARLDDLVNLVPARLSGVLMALCAPLVGGGAVHSLTIMWRDAGLHRSPNAGWPESAMAAGLGLALAGPRRYGETVVDEPFLNREASPQATPADITRALRLLVAACAVLFGIVCGLALLWV
jgi:adenosylcobinamide-phosphate synthase